jgi:diacylglycerol kinase family enzyme
MTELGIIINPKSRANLRKPGRIKEYSHLGSGSISLYPTGSIDELIQTARHFKKTGIPYLGISGGDGTIHQVISAFISVYKSAPIPPILLLGDGTMNNIAHSMGMREHGKQVLKNFLRSMEMGRICLESRGTIQIKDRYCFLFGCGLTSNFLIEAYRDGKKGYIQNLEVIRKCFDEVLRSQFTKDKKFLQLLRPLGAEIYASGKKLPLEELLVVLAGTVEEIGMGFKPLIKAGHKKGHFHLIATDLEPRKVLMYFGFIGIGKGHLVKNPRYIDMLVKDMKIKAPAPFEYTMDGDMYLCPGTLHVKAGPDVRFIMH